VRGWGRVDFEEIIMNAHTPPTQPTLSLVASPRRAVDPVTRAHTRFSRQLRAAAAQYVRPVDVDDLLQDTWVVASRMPAKLTASDATVLSWLIGIAKRCAPTYVDREIVEVPIDELLLREAGDDLEGRAMHEAPEPRTRGARGKRRE
jgi:DNA-directed RNA polymerase specialized sigma24 family protein